MGYIISQILGYIDFLDVFALLRILSSLGLISLLSLPPWWIYRDFFGVRFYV